MLSVHINLLMHSKLYSALQICMNAGTFSLNACKCSILLMHNQTRVNNAVSAYCNFSCLVVCLSLITPCVQRRRRQVIGIGVRMYVCVQILFFGIAL